MTTMAEPEWDDQMRGLVMEHANLDICGACGGLAIECQDPEHQDDWVAGDPVRCHRETARLLRQKGVTEETNPGVHALLWPVRLREGTY